MGLVLRIKNVNIMGVQWKILFSRIEAHKKNKNREDCLKRGLEQLADLIGLAEKK